MPVHLHIPTPCAEKWSAMTSTAADCRFCAGCQKSIVDFTQKTDAEILAHLQRHGRICGRFRKGQLDRPLLDTRAGRRTGLTAVAAGLAAFLTAQQPVMIGPKAPTTDLGQMPADSRPATVSPPPTRDSLQTIAGQILLAGIPEGAVGATVALLGTGYRTTAGLEGAFSLQVPVDTLTNREIVLKCTYTGYLEQTVNLSGVRPAEIMQITCTLASAELLLGEVVYTKPSLKYKIKRFFHRLR